MRICMAACGDGFKIGEDRAHCTATGHSAHTTRKRARQGSGVETLNVTVNNPRLHLYRGRSNTNRDNRYTNPSNDSTLSYRRHTYEIDHSYPTGHAHGHARLFSALQVSSYDRRAPAHTGEWRGVTRYTTPPTAERTSPQHRHGDGRRSHVRRPGVLSLIPTMGGESQTQRAQSQRYKICTPNHNYAIWYLVPVHVLMYT